MANKYILERLNGIQAILNGVHSASKAMTNATKGAERQSFIDDFLNNVFPNQFRFGTGDATDQSGNRSGQLDVVIEYPFSPSLPLPSGDARLYLAESIAAVIEVKSNVESQWSQAVQTAKLLAPLKRDFGSYLFIGKEAMQDIPLFVVGYTGWAKLETLQGKIKSEPNIHGVLIIDSGLFVSSGQLGNISLSGGWALWGFIVCLHSVMSKMKTTSFNPWKYYDHSSNLFNQEGLYLRDETGITTQI